MMMKAILTETMTSTRIGDHDDDDDGVFDDNAADGDRDDDDDHLCQNHLFGLSCLLSPSPPLQ